MSVLSDNTIKGLTDVISPFDIRNIQPNSYELHIDREILIPAETLTPDDVFFRGQKPEFVKREAKDGILILKPHVLTLASTLERVNIPYSLTATVEGKSSWARLGLFVHITAGFIDSGFTGNITLELFNAAPYTIGIKVGEPIAQLVFHTLDGEVKKPYGHKDLNSHYQNQNGVTQSR